MPASTAPSTPDRTSCAAAPSRPVAAEVLTPGSTGNMRALLSIQHGPGCNCPYCVRWAGWEARS